MRKTKIIATLGPSTEDPKILTKLLEQVDVVRINLAHGTWDKRDPENHADKIKKRISGTIGLFNENQMISISYVLKCNFDIIC